jgi:amino acid transporter
MPGYSQQPLADAATLMIGRWGGGLIAAAAVVSIIGTLGVLLLSGSRIPYAFSTEGQMPAVFSRVHPRFRTPTASILVVAVAVFAASVTWSFLGALTIASIIRVLVYLSVIISLMRLRKMDPAPATPFFKLRWGIPLAGLAILLCGWLLSASGYRQMITLIICIFAGLAFFAFYTHYRERKA